MAKKEQKVRWIRAHDMEAFASAVFWLKQTASSTADMLEKSGEPLSPAMREMLATELRRVLNVFVYQDSIDE
jgi:uncharacterized membrane protein